MLARILMIDDEPDIRQVAKLALEEVGGFVVDLAGSGPDGIAAVRRSRPDLILLDVMMPGMDGLGTLAALRAEGLDAPVVFMTAKVQRHEVEEYRSLGALDVISKPFDPMTLSAEVRAIWEGADVQ